MPPSPPPMQTTPLMHRIYEGSPVKVLTPKRVFEMASKEGTLVWKARRVTQPEDLDPGEVFITHRKITNDVDCAHALANIGVSQTVLVSEALGVLGEDVDQIFQSLSGTAQHKKDIEIIMGSVKSMQGKGSFSRFGYSLYTGCQQDGPVYDAIVRSGMDLFWDVLETVAGDNPKNESFKWMISFEEDAEFKTLKAWSKMFGLLEGCHQKSHPFSFVGGDIHLAERALEVLQFVAAESTEEKYKDLACLISAAIPILGKKILIKKMNAMKAKAQEEIDENMVRTRQPRRER